MKFNSLYSSTINFLTENQTYPLPEHLDDRKRLMYAVVVNGMGQVHDIVRTSASMGLWEVFDNGDFRPHTTLITREPVSFEIARHTLIKWFNQRYTQRLYRHDEYQPDTYDTNVTHERTQVMHKINEALEPLDGITGQWKVLCIHDSVEAAVALLDVDVAAYKGSIAGKALHSLKNNSLVNKLFTPRT